MILTDFRFRTALPMCIIIQGCSAAVMYLIGHIKLEVSGCLLLLILWAPVVSTLTSLSAIIYLFLRRSIVVGFDMGLQRRSEGEVRCEK